MTTGRMQAAAALALSSLLLAGCGAGSASRAGGSSSTPVTPTPTTPASISSDQALPLDGCVQPGEGRRFTLRLGSRSVAGVVLGAGSGTAVLSNQSDGTLCGWLPEARRLAGQGLRVVLWDQDAVAWPDALAAVVAAQRAQGAGKVVLVGASKGGWASVVASGSVRPPVDGVVSLSGESSLRQGPSALPALARYRGPLLVICARGDGLCSDTLTSFPNSHGASRTTLVSLPGSDHGWQLLDDDNAEKVRTGIETFLHRVLAA